MLEANSRSLCMANGEGFVRPFSQRLIVGSVTPSLAANFSWVSSRCVRTARIAVARSVLSAKSGLSWVSRLPDHLMNQVSSIARGGSVVNGL